MLPALILMSIGLGIMFVPMQNLALFGVDEDDAGVASALVNASQQIGGSLGIALSVFLWAAGVAILIAPLALLLITITKETFSGSDENQPIHLC